MTVPRVVAKRTAKLKSFKSLADIPKMLSAVKEQESSHTVQAEDSLPRAVWKAVSVGSECTMENVVKRVSILNCEAEYIEAIVYQFVAAGILTTKNIPAAKGLIKVFQLKKGATMAAYTNGNSIMSPPSAASLQSSMLSDPIRSDDSLDLAIYKVMCDHKTRDVHEIASLLERYLFPKENVKNRIIALMKQGWFTRKEHNGYVQYILKKHVPRPNSVTASTINSSLYPEDEEETTPMEHHVAPLYMPTSSTSPLLSESPASFHQKKTDDLVIHPTDKVEVMIWKIMSDGAAYKVSDLVLLLGEYDVRKNSVSPRMSDLNKKGWFNISTNNPGERAVSYILKKEIPMPATIYARKKVEMIPTSQSKVPHVALSPEEAGWALKPSVTSKAEPLVNASVSIRGQALTFHEANELIRELVAFGFGIGRITEIANTSATPLQRVINPNIPSILVTSFTIKGMVFTFEELDEIAHYLVSAGFGGVTPQPIMRNYD